MATSSFTRNYKVPKNTADEFVNEMSQKGESVPYKSFRSNLMHLEDYEKLREQIHEALGNMPDGNESDPGKE